MQNFRLCFEFNEVVVVNNWALGCGHVCEISIK